MNRALIYRQGKPTELPGFPPAAPHRRSTGHMGPLSADAGHPASQHFSLTFIKRGTGNRNTQVYFQTTLKKKKKALLPFSQERELSHSQEPKPPGVKHSVLLRQQGRRLRPEKAAPGILGRLPACLQVP